MPDEIKQRLQDSTEKCVKSYEAWCKDKKNAEARETLQEAVHEVRKVASRLEIELVTSDRDNAPQKPMPAPSHRNAKGRHQNGDEAADGNKSAEKKEALAKLKKKPAEKKEEKSKEE